MKKYVHVVGAIITNESNEVFCALRSDKMSLPNLWEFPGGKIEDNESKEDALKREIAEEFLCKIEVFDQVEDTTYEYDTFIVRLETFNAKITDGQPIAQEHAETRWVPINKLDSLNFAPADIPAVDKIVSSIK